MSVTATTDPKTPIDNNSLNLGPSTDSFCFLISVIAAPVSSTVPEPATMPYGCDINDNGTDWILAATAARVGALEVFTTCRARCVDFGTPVP